MAVGVARPKEHGHAITSTEINIVSENTQLCPDIRQAKDEIIDSVITIGTK
jgi:hypothetical protein